ncbi:MAG: primosomal protein N', partial [Burkholderiaceae bacterium]
MAVDAPQHTGLAAPLTYESERLLPPGSMVRVPLGRRDVPGVVWPGTPDADLPIDLKAVSQVLGALAPLSAAWCELVEFAASYYQRGVGEVALAVLPPEVRKLDDAQLANRIRKAVKAQATGPEDPGPASAPDFLARTGPGVAVQAGSSG